jgi:hypothetical protein
LSAQASAPRAGAEPLPEALAALRGCAVTRFIVDDSLTLVMQAAGRDASLRIDGEGLLERAGVPALRISPDADPAGLAPVLALLNARVTDVALGVDGRLELRFEGGTRLAALPADHHVSWSVQSSATGTGDSSASCIAEGRVVWQ